MGNVRCIQVMLLIVALLWIGAGGFSAWTPLASELARGQQPAPPQADAGNVIRARAVLEATGHDDLRSLAGQPLAVLSVVPEGKVVKKGDLLVELDASSLVERSEEQQIRHLKAEAELQVAEASLSGRRQEAANAVEIAEKALQLAQKELKVFYQGEYPAQEIDLRNDVLLAKERLNMAAERLEQLKAEAEADKALLAQARIAQSEVQAQLTAAESRLRLLQDALKQRRIDQLDLAIAQRELDLLHARNELKRITVQDEAAVRIAEKIERMERECVLRLNHWLAGTKLYAPRDGTVFYPNDAPLRAPRKGNLRAGDVVRSGQVIVRVADLTQVKLDVRLPLSQARKLAPGGSATIRFDAIPGRTFHGHATGIKTLTDAAGGPEEGLISIRLDDPGKGLRPGMTATVEFDLSDT